MLTAINPKLPMRSRAATIDYYVSKLGFEKVGQEDYNGYLMLRKDHVEIKFFEFKTLNPKKNYGQVYIRTNAIDKLYQSCLSNKIGNTPQWTVTVETMGTERVLVIGS